MQPGLNSISPADIALLPPDLRRDLSMALGELDRRWNREERMRVLTLTKPSDPNHYGIPSNDQYGALTCPKKQIFIRGGNRSQKSETGAYAMASLCLGTHPYLSKVLGIMPPVRTRGVGNHLTDHVLGVMVRKLQTLIPHNQLYGGSWRSAFNESKMTIKYANGSVSSFRSCEQDQSKHAGDDLDFIWIDEHVPFKIYIENLARLIDRNGSLMYTMTADLGNITWERRYMKQNHEDIGFYRFTMEGNPHISKEGIESAKKSFSYDKALYAIKIEGRDVELAGAVIPQYGDHVLMDDKDVQRLLHSPENIYNVFVLDPHMKKDSAMLWAFWTKEKEFIVHKVAKKFLTIPDLKAYIKAQSVGLKINLWIGDEAMGGSGENIFGQNSVLQQLQTGTDALPIMPTSQSSDKTFEAGVFKLREMMAANPVSGKPRLRIAKSCYQLQEELEGYQFLPDTKMDEYTFRERVLKINDDLIDCARYGVMAEPTGYVGAAPVESAIGGAW